MITEKDNIC